MNKLNFAFSFCGVFCVCFTKLAIVLFYYRVFTLPGFRKIVIFTLVFMGLYTLALFIIFLLGFSCIPVYTTNEMIIVGGGVCVYTNTFNWIDVAIHILTDLWIFLLPLKVLWNLQLPLKKKIGLGFILCIGCG